MAINSTIILRANFQKRQHIDILEYFLEIFLGKLPQTHGIAGEEPVIATTRALGGEGTQPQPRP